MNKKAQTFNVGTVMALFLFGFLAIAFFGGIGKMAEIIGVLIKVPAWVWIVGLVIFIFMRWTK